MSALEAPHLGTDEVEGVSKGKEHEQEQWRGNARGSREERVVLAVVEAARCFTWQTAQQWHRAIGR